MSRAWSQMWDLFHGALGIDASTRDAWLRERCPDESLRNRLGSLLAAHERADDFLESGSGWGLPAGGPGGTKTLPAALDRYRLAEKIGEGGFSEVYRARQIEPVQRDVAVKVLRASLADSGRRGQRILERFEAERQTLASLNHPGIATIFDAGVSPDGRPYFVMELIAGSPITRFCDDRGLPLRRRLDLFIEACAAVQHAHHKGVIHRDLKPSNILVTEIDGVPRVKIIDFGIATLVEEAGAGTIPSASRWRGGTPGYMSPEQAQTGDTDTRTDVFSLGVVLYQLLTGAVPFPVPADPLTMQAIERARLDSSADPAPPSARVQGSAARRLRGELDWITLKALSRDRTGRYTSAEELAADIRRHLDRRPVLAGPATARYRASRFLARHRFGAAVAAAAIAVLVTGVILLAVKARTEARLRAEAVTARELAIREAQLSEQAATFLRVDVLSTAAARPESSAVMLEILDAAEKRIPERFKDNALGEAAARRTLGDIYAQLRRADRAIPNAERAVEILTGELGAEDRHTNQAVINLAIAYRQAGRFSDALPLYERSGEFWRRANGPESREAMAQDLNRAQVLVDLGRFGEAERLLRDVRPVLTRVYGAEDMLTANAAYGHGNALQGLERWADAEEAYLAAYASQKKLGEDNLRPLVTRSRLAAVLAESGRAAEAEPTLRNVIEINTRRIGPDHLDTLTVQAVLARCLAYQERFEEAEPMLRTALDRFRAELGPDHIRVAGLSNATGDFYMLWGRPAESEPHFRHAADTARAELDETNANRAKYTLDHGLCLLELAKFPEAEDRLREAAGLLASTLGPAHPLTARANEALTAALQRQGEASAAPPPGR